LKGILGGVFRVILRVHFGWLTMFEIVHRLVKMVDFGDNCSTVLAFFAPGNKVNEPLLSWKMDVQLWNEKKGTHFVIFGTSKMILHI
jgi:hypothetical protein